MKTLKSFVTAHFRDGDGSRAILVNPSTEEPLAEIISGGFSSGQALEHARRVGGPALASLTFAERGERLKKISKLIHEHRDELIGLAIANGGNTRSDAKFDIDGAIGTLANYAELGQKLGATRFLIDGDGIQLTRSVRFFGQHLFVPRAGVAVHINAFNFPAWNMMEKAATALLAGMPVLTKPATATALVAHRIIELIVHANVLPEGALSLVLGATGDLLSHLSGQDVLAFTGSSQTGALLRGHPNIVAASVRVTLETDSLNAAVLGPDLSRGQEGYDLFIADVVRDMTQKTGQKCTAIRRILVPLDQLDAVREDLVERLSSIKVGNPMREEVNMGPLATAAQLRDVRAGLSKLREESKSVFGGDGTVEPIGAPTSKGYFLSPVLLESSRPAEARAVHEHEVFGPVATLLPYSGAASEAIALVARSDGGLVSSIYSDARAFVEEAVLGLAPHHGRLFLGSSKLVGHAVGPGTVLPQLIHGGPGRAGGGEELGGERGLSLYMQRTALAGDKPVLDALFSRRS
jgi:3,4-dehydroadipyl-CoA semialdehyde dehydrogenase